MNFNPEDEALAEKEAWAQRVAGLVSVTRDMDFELALKGARWASMWVDDYQQLIEQQPPTITPAEEKSVIDQAMWSALARLEDIPRYPTGAPSLKATIAATDAFCLAFAEQATAVAALLNWPLLLKGD